MRRLHGKITTYRDGSVARLAHEKQSACCAPKSAAVASCC
jgi:hypothetical protein